MIIEMVGVAVEPAKIICQTIVPVKGACGPATFLNALRFGPPAFQDAFAGLPGDTDAEKLAGIIATHGAQASAILPWNTLFGRKGGVWADDARRYLKSILGAHAERLLPTYFETTGKESPSEFLHRVHALLLSSLERGVPVITVIRGFAARKRDDESFVWEAISGHFVLLVRVPRIINPGAQGFVFQFVEPGFGKLYEGYIYAETVRAFQALKESCMGYSFSETTEEYEPIPGSLQSSHWIKNGFLHVVSSSLHLETYKEPWHARTFLTLDFGLGKFGREHAPSK